ncbi:MAG: hypothetical protein HRU11_06975 [Parvularculaceae bacterium]|nr:hypothetical protein [Parvularculaceae bacterium]
MTGLKEQLAAQTPLLGTFLKTPSPIVCEVMNRAGMDLVCIDAEHAPFGRTELDLCLMAFRAGGTPAIVRVPELAPAPILNALDCGATGVLVPHVLSGEQAQKAVDFSLYGQGRGFAGSSRSAGYMAKSMADHVVSSNATTCVIGQIEDAEALGALDDILAVDQMDALFIGRADLTVSLGYDNPNTPEVVEAVTEICRKGKERGRTIGMFTGNTAEIASWREQGASLFLLSSEHAMMLDGARRLNETVRAQF